MTNTSHMTGVEHFEHWITENKHLLLCPLPEDADELKERLSEAHEAGIHHAIDCLILNNHLIPVDVECNSGAKENI